ncbi:MAG: chromate transporter [Treponemataceae bacterium]|nr:MAG: chromate transporter [Treponemataceae bacterium]
MSLLALFFTFFKIGLFTIGGGLVAITLMYHPLVETGLISSERFYQMVAISESTPGPVGINMATYVGYEFYGIPGALAVTAGTVLPSLICIMLVAFFFNAFNKKPVVQSIFAVLRPVTTAVIAVAAFQVYVISLVRIDGDSAMSLDSPLLERFSRYSLNVPQCIFFVCALVLLLKTKIHPALVIVLSAAFGMLLM